MFELYINISYINQIIRSSKTTVRVCVCVCVLRVSVCPKFYIQLLFSSASSFPSFILLSPPLLFISKIFCVMISIFAAWEWIYCVPEETVG